jgi:hypothetical protein
MTGKKSSGKITGSILVSIIAFIVFSIGFFPLIFYVKSIFLFISFTKIWHLFLIPFLIYIGIFLILFFQLLISGLFIYAFNLKYKPGVYEYNYRNKDSFKWVIVCVLYTPMRKLLEIFSMGGMKDTYYRLLGMKIGKNSLVGGTIMDPCLTEIGDNCTMGLFSVIYGHIHDYEKGTVTMKTVKVGNNVVIGAGAIIMPGAIIEDNVKIATGAVVRKGQVLKKDQIYGGIPAKIIKKKKNKMNF